MPRLKRIGKILLRLSVVAAIVAYTPWLPFWPRCNSLDGWWDHVFTPMEPVYVARIQIRAEEWGHSSLNLGSLLLVSPYPLPFTDSIMRQRSREIDRQYPTTPRRGWRIRTLQTHIWYRGGDWLEGPIMGVPQSELEQSNPDLLHRIRLYGDWLETTKNGAHRQTGIGDGFHAGHYSCESVRAIVHLDHPPGSLMHLLLERDAAERSPDAATD